MKKVILILVLFLAVFVSGCIENGNNGQNETKPVSVSDLVVSKSFVDFLVGPEGTAWKYKNTTLKKDEILSLIRSEKVAEIRTENTERGLVEEQITGTWEIFQDKNGNHTVFTGTFENESIKIIYGCIELVLEEEFAKEFTSSVTATRDMNAPITCQGERRRYKIF